MWLNQKQQDSGEVGLDAEAVVWSGNVWLVDVRDRYATALPAAVP